ncbi:MAG: hypothetical protein ACD_30C00039G0006 [uncultured bacterium]|uniref:Uncharacterized protein n=4 Tax=Candidatus Daviesiibacteriota TaxID=1752718 RepID=A0A0G0ENF7_9BACT|nr:MAG: hypothetical protein ACD_30C00039G0006 [uncultured bacterium]KKQ08548.1 MAG: hypothetical protein US19_C0022G0009 [Candidatus Daviesbacteria bacterium GW2011_GWB1_36_5]KKQ13914.1 MAG: hypothetical protein US28_C0042G0013 [Candidatus Daviesbacteria bacterium GW2011_GWA1_36_8]OGE17104.1 MAG: hypothetical protein A2858_00160 [Candidatus Daviesbacteria bacterium RIFCSPHIGHO2_01_FULL_36_37]OGE31254.1 MAG: hypothetical protein A3C99_01245 [Candidatus Daviesbacteria bacterium RIFCSPHIGHO2_02_F
MDATNSALINVLGFGTEEFTREIIQVISRYMEAFILGGLVTLVITGLVKEFFENRKYHKDEKRKWANEVIAIVNEGNSCNYKTQPGDSRHINFVATQLEAYDSQMPSKLRTHLLLWLRIAFAFSNKPKGMHWKEDEKLLIEDQNEITKLSDDLIGAAHKLKK